MKCIRFNGIVYRTTDEEALRLVEGGEACFATKTEWKDDGRQWLLDKAGVVARASRQSGADLARKEADSDV